MRDSIHERLLVGNPHEITLKSDDSYTDSFNIIYFFNLVQKSNIYVKCIRNNDTTKHILKQIFKRNVFLIIRRNINTYVYRTYVIVIYLYIYIYKSWYRE